MNDSVTRVKREPSRAMRREVLTNAPGAKSSRAAAKSSQRLTRSQKRRRRLRNQYNREYMRRWRSTPNQKPRKKRCLRGTNPRSTQGRFRPKSKIRAKNDGAPICGICRRLRAICVVTRLQLTQDTESGFRSVRIPYCGFC